MWGNNYNGFQQGGGGGYPQQFGQIPQNYGQQGYGQITAAPMRDDRIWVEGEEAARSFLVAANSSAVLWDSGSDTIYFKRTDVSGRPLPMMILDFTVRDQNQKPDYVTRQEFLQAMNTLLAQTKTAPAAPIETEVANNA
jgi:hypothetical protein